MDSNNHRAIYKFIPTFGPLVRDTSSLYCLDERIDTHRTGQTSSKNQSDRV